MSKSLFVKSIEKILGGATAINMLTDTLKAVLINLAAAGKSVTGATNATPVVVTVSTHGYANGDVVIIKGITGNTNANGKFVIANVTTNTFELTNFDTGANIAGNGTFGGTAYALNMSQMEYLADFAAPSRVATSAALTSQAITGGAFSAAAVTFSTVSGSVVDGTLIIKDTGSAATSPCIHYEDDYTGLPVTPNGGNIVVTWDTAINKIFRIRP